ncbi:hypothetical protein ACN47E_009703 [Coniothyrium glycines]
MSPNTPSSTFSPFEHPNPHVPIFENGDVLPQFQDIYYETGIEASPRLPTVHAYTLTQYAPDFGDGDLFLDHLSKQGLISKREVFKGGDEHHERNRTTQQAKSFTYPDLANDTRQPQSSQDVDHLAVPPVFSMHRASLSIPARPQQRVSHATITSIDLSIYPVPGFPTPKPAQAKGTGAQLLRYTTLPAGLSDSCDEAFVIRRVQHRDFENLQYTMDEMEEVTKWVAGEQIDELRYLLNAEFQSIRPRRTLLQNVRSRGELGHLRAWCMRMPQRVLPLWDSEEIVQMLQKYNLKRDLTIFDLITLTKRAKACVEKGTPIELGLPPSHELETAPARATKKTKQPRTRIPRTMRKTPSHEVSSLSQPSAHFLNSALLPNTAYETRQTQVQDTQSRYDRQPRNSQDLEKEQSTPTETANVSLLISENSPTGFSALTDRRTVKGKSFPDFPNVDMDISRRLRKVTNEAALDDHSNTPFNQRLRRHATVLGPQNRVINSEQSAEADLVHAASRKRAAEDGHIRSKKARVDEGPSVCAISEMAAQNFSTAYSVAHVSNSDAGPRVALTASLRPSPEQASHVSDVSVICVSAKKHTVADELCFKIVPGEFHPECFDQARIGDYIAHLAEQHWQAPLSSQQQEYAPLPPERDIASINWRLDSLMHSLEPTPLLFRDLPGSQAGTVSLLSRCVRFAQSHAQQNINWRVHPAHVHEILQRTNPYGHELLITRHEVVVGSWADPEKEYHTLLATRASHAKFALGDKGKYTSADVPAIVADLLCDPGFAQMYALELSDEDHYPAFVPEMYAHALGLR